MWIRDRICRQINGEASSKFLNSAFTCSVKDTAMEMIHERKIPFYKWYHFKAYPDIDLRCVIKKNMKANPTKIPGKKYRFSQPQAGQGFYRGHRRHKPKDKNMKNWTSSEIKLHIGNNKERVETTGCHKQRTWQRTSEHMQVPGILNHEADHTILEVDKRQVLWKKTKAEEMLGG